MSATIARLWTKPESEWGGYCVGCWKWTAKECRQRGISGDQTLGKACLVYLFKITRALPSS